MPFNNSFFSAGSVDVVWVPGGLAVVGEPDPPGVVGVAGVAGAP